MLLLIIELQHFRIIASFFFLQIIPVPQFFVFYVIVQEGIQLIHFEIGNDLTKFVNVDVESLQLIVDLGIFFVFLFLCHLIDAVILRCYDTKMRKITGSQY